jgi:hypothetical protein
VRSPEVLPLPVADVSDEPLRDALLRLEPDEPIVLAVEPELPLPELLIEPLELGLLLLAEPLVLLGLEVLAEPLLPLVEPVPLLVVALGALCVLVLGPGVSFDD